MSPVSATDLKLTPTNLTRSRLVRSVEIGLQPVFLIASLAIWFVYPGQPAIYLVVLIGGQVLLGTLEHIIPRRRDWLQPVSELSRNIAIAIVILVVSIVLTILYESTLAEPLAELRSTLHLDIWPARSPLLLQVFLAFLLAELIQYWIHRAEHRFGLI